MTGRTIASPLLRASRQRLRSRGWRTLAALAIAPWLLAQTAAPPPHPIGSVDAPQAEAIVGTSMRLSGWALDPDGIAGVDIEFAGGRHHARIGVPRTDVAAAKPGFPQSAAAGFEFEGRFSTMPPLRQPFRIVARSTNGATEVLARKSLIPPSAFALWNDGVAPSNAASRPFHFLMATSGLSRGGAIELDTQYSGYASRTLRIGLSVPILYLRTTRGSAADWVFDPAFDIARTCGERAMADDSLDGVIAFVTAKRIPIQFILNGGIWADATCNVPEWDLNDHLEDDIANCQWAENNVVYPDDYLRNLSGSLASPELARSLTYNVYASDVRRYKKRNLQAAARRIAQFAREHPDLFVGIALDSDTYLNPFFEQRAWFDYNPGTIRQFREWLRGAGPYAGKGGREVPDLTIYRRKHPLTLAEVNGFARERWRSWDEVDPPRKFPGSTFQPPVPGQPAVWDDPWFQEWDTFRKHLVQLHYAELAAWANEAGIPAARIFTAQGFVAPEGEAKPFAVRVTSRGQNYDSGGVSVEGAIPRSGHLGAILYGHSAENRVRMEGRHGLFATFDRMDRAWAVTESNIADLKASRTLPDYAPSYREFRDLWNYDARQVALMAWNGSNGIYAGDSTYVAYTSWRNTPAEEAMRDFMVSHANLAPGARLWTFGSAQHEDDDGWSVDGGTLEAGRARATILPVRDELALVAPLDQVIRRANAGTLVLGLADKGAVAAIEVFARTGPDAKWERLSPRRSVASLAAGAAGVRMPLAWPKSWTRETIAEELRIVLRVPDARPPIVIDRIALLPPG